MKPTSSKIKAILHPVRARIIVALNDRPLTPRQIAAQMEEVPLGTVYRHVNLLLEAGIIEVVRERRVYGTLERQFALIERSSFLTEEDREKLTGEDILGLMTTLMTVVQSAFQRYVREAEMPPKPGEVSFVAKSLYLTSEEYTEFREHVYAMMSKVGRESQPEYHRRLIGFFSVPDPEIAVSDEWEPD